MSLRILEYLPFKKITRGSVQPIGKRRSRPELKLFKYVHLGQIKTQMWLANCIRPKLEILFTPSGSSVAEYSIHLQFFYQSLHSFPTILGFYVRWMGRRTSKSAIIPFFMSLDIGTWSSSPSWSGQNHCYWEKCTKSSFQLSLSSRRIICAKFVQFSIGHPPIVHPSMRQSNVFSNWCLWHSMLSPKWYVVFPSYNTLTLLILVLSKIESP